MKQNLYLHRSRNSLYVLQNLGLLDNKGGKIRLNGSPHADSEIMLATKAYETDIVKLAIEILGKQGNVPRMVIGEAVANKFGLPWSDLRRSGMDLLYFAGQTG